jgi:hypothetical protein
MKFPILIMATLLLLAATWAQPVSAKELVGEFKGERSMQTGAFDVKGPWILEWRVTGEYAREMAVDISLVEAKSNIHQGSVLKARGPGNGVRLFTEGGEFFFRVDSTLAGWVLRVEQLTREEAELYTPRNSRGLDY